MAGGAEVGGQVYFSTNAGVRWSLLPLTTVSPNILIADPMELTNFQYGCLAINYVAAAGAPQGYHKQLLLYGGFLNAQQVTNTGFGCSQLGSSTAYTSIVADLLFPGETVSDVSEYSAPTSATNVSMIFHDAANQLIYRAYSFWHYDVHAAITRSSNVRMWQFGGFTSYDNPAVPAWSFIPTVDYTATGNWNAYTTFTPTYGSTISTSPGYAVTGGKSAAGLALLMNQNLLLFGGKDSNSTQWTNDVYLSTDNGRTWGLQLYPAPWYARSDMSVAVMPGLNVVVMVGGQGNNPASPNNPNAPLQLMDTWFSTDGAGKVWQLGTSAPIFGLSQDAAFVALYDNSAVNPSNTQQYSTLLINPGVIQTAYADGIFSSTDAGKTWNNLGPAPWTQRIRGSFVADMEGYVYMLGGSPSTSGDIWLSNNKGVSWTFVGQTTTSKAFGNLFTFQSAQQNCVALRYASNSNSPNNWHKQLVMFGGPADPNPEVNLVSMQMTQQPASSCVRTVPANVVYAEIMFPQELAADQQGSFQDTLNTAAGVQSSSAPVVAFNNPTALITYRQYASCATDVHAVANGNTPLSFALGGWDVNGKALTTIDKISGANVQSYSLVTPQWISQQWNTSSSPYGRIAAFSAYTAGGVLLWGAGKYGPSSTYANDVWYSTNQGGSFYVATIQAPWYPRSDSANLAIPGTNCVLIIGGEGVSVSASGNFQSGEILFNDVWSSCDNMGASWTQQTGTAAFPLAQQSAVVALFDNTGSASNPTNTIVYYSWQDQTIRSSQSMGKTWTTLAQAQWSQRYARFIADTSNNIYMTGGMNPNDNQGDSSNYNNGVGEVWYSSSKGQTWNRLTQSTNIGYNSPVTLSAAAYSCAAMTSGSGHRQMLIYSNWIEVYSAQTTVVSSVGSFGPTGHCSCDSLNGIRAVTGDLVFPGESPNNLPSSSSSKTFSRGATAGIAVGVGVGVGLLCCIAAVFFMSATGGKKGSSAGPTTSNGRAKKLEEEHSSTQSSVEPTGVEMEQRA